MRYQISYFSPNGHAETLANAFCQILPRDTCAFNLENDVTPDAEVQLVGFDMSGTNLDAIPVSVMEYLEKLEGKIIFLFATVPFTPNDYIRSRVNNSVIPFLPDECDYRGLYLCSAQPSDTLLRGLQHLVAHQPSNDRAKHWLERCQEAVGHPDATDLQKGCRFARHVLELDV